MVGTAIATRQARIALDVGAEPVRFENPLLPDTRSEIALPLTITGRIIGVLDVQSIQEAAFTEQDIDTLQGMANNVATALIMPAYSAKHKKASKICALSRRNM